MNHSVQKNAFNSEPGIPLDKWVGTFRDRLPDGIGAKRQEEHK